MSATDALLPERVAGRGQGSELAAGSEGRLLAYAADVLSSGNLAFDLEPLVETAGCGQGWLSYFAG
jgi:hypothetical protein